MIVVLDSNVFLSALITPSGNSASIYEAWRAGRFQIATCTEQLNEIKAASRNPKFADILQPREVGVMLNRLRATRVPEPIPRRYVASDPTDSFLLNLAAAVSAHFLITGDKRAGLLQQRTVETTRILNPAQFCTSVLSRLM